MFSLRTCNLFGYLGCSLRLCVYLKYSSGHWSFVFVCVLFRLILFSLSLGHHCPPHPIWNVNSFKNQNAFCLSLKAP